MLFNSFSFAVFFPIVLSVYYLLEPRYRVVFLLAASCFFYMYFVPKYIVILFSLITIDFFLALNIEKTNSRVLKKYLLIISIVANLGILIFFKYSNFLNELTLLAANLLHFKYSFELLQIVLPLGLSFHVFQSLSYVIEVYKNKVPAEKKYVTYALYVMFFPQLVAGPIERPGHLLPQLHTTHSFDPLKARRGLERMLWGFFKKLVIADQLAQIVDPIFNSGTSSGPMIVIGALLFAYQLYADFSGYCDIAIGSAMMLGFSLSENFQRPFSARTITELWRKWHISLSTWLRDYLYYPLAFSLGKVTKVKLYITSFVTFTLIGLWHGANMTFVIFGALQGVYLIVEAMTMPLRKKFYSIPSNTFQFVLAFFEIILTFFLFSFSLIFFRSVSVSQALYFIKHLNSDFSIPYLSHEFLPLLFKPFGYFMGVVLLASLIFVEVIQYLQDKNKTFYIFDSCSKTLRYSYYYFLVIMIILFGYFGESPFIYFKF